MSVKLDGREVKIGDRLWHFILGWGTVYTTANYTDCAYNRICVRFDLPNKKESFGIDGKSISDGRNRGLFWDEIKFEIPPPPKKKIKKWQWICLRKGGRYFLTGYHYATREEAEKTVLNSSVEGKLECSMIEVDEE